MITQMDVAKFGPLAQRVSGISRDSMTSPSPLRMTFFAAMQKNRMSGGLRIDLDEVKEAVRALKKEHAPDSKMMKVLGPALDRMFERTPRVEAPEATGEFQYELF